MKITLTLKILFSCLVVLTSSAFSSDLGDYDVSAKFPYGQKNPAAPPEVADYEPMIGLSSCVFTARNTDGSWKKPVKTKWVFKYIMNGNGVQDEIYKEDNGANGSIRQYNHLR
jgi:hypothetical protein